MERTPSNTREQCAFDSGKFKRRMLTGSGRVDHDEASWRKMRDQRNPHKKGSPEHQFWNEGFDSV